MSNVDLHPLPGWTTVAREQFLTAALAMRGLMVIATGFVALAAYFMVHTVSRISAPTLAPMVIATPVAILCFMLPQGLWRGEDPAQRAYFLSMPVGRFRHQLLKNGVGWLWAMILSSAFYLLAVVAATVTSSRITDSAPWQWAAPFVGGTVAFLAATSVSTALNQSVRWVLGGYFALVLLVSTGAGTALTQGRYGLITLATGAEPGTSPGAWLLSSNGTMPATSLSDWLIACALWVGMSLAAVVLASRVHRDA